MTDASEKSGSNLSSDPPASGRTFAPETILAGKYRVVSLLGAGGMGTVYRVQQVFLKKEFALKSMDSRHTSDALLRRFQLEAKAASHLSHPNLVKVHDFGFLDDEQPYLVMDLIDGITLAELLKTKGPLAWQQAAPMFAQVCLGLSYAHEQGVVHRDIKPGNLMIVNGLPNGSEGSIKVVDFGIAKLIGTDEGEILALTRTGEVFGSPLYMSPEQCSGAEVDNRADVYALGCVLFEALTGTPPLVGTNALATMMLHQSQPAPTLKEASLGKEFPTALEQIVEKMLRKLPADRYQTLGLVAHDLANVGTDSYLNPHSFEKPTSSKPKSVIPPAARNFYPLLALVLLCIATASGLFVGAYYYLQNRDRSSVSNDVSFAKYPPLNNYDKSVAEKKAMLEKAEPIKSVIVTHDGQQKRKFVFPACGIGYLRRYDSEDPFQQTRVQHTIAARGTVYMPANTPLVLQLETGDFPGVLETPTIIEKIDPGEFYGLSVKSGVFSMESGQLQKRNLEKILQTAAHWPNLNLVELDSLAEDRKVLIALSDSKSLRAFSLNVPIELSSDDLKNLSFLRQLNNLELSDVLNADVGEVIQNVAGSPNLETLSVNNSAISADSIASLSRCANLSFLLLTNQAVNDQILQAIAKLKTLRTIQFREINPHLYASQIKKLLASHSIKVILLPAQSYTLQERKELHMLDSRIRFE